MAVYERSYRLPSAKRTPELTRFLVIPRYAYQQVFASKLFIAFLVLCFIYPLVCAVGLYLPHNLKFLKLFDLSAKDVQPIVEGLLFPMRFMGWQGFLLFLMVFFVGPAQISADLRNNALPLYLARPFSRSEYVLGKMSVLLILMSAVTWIPGVLLFLFQSFLMGWGWFADNLRMLFAIVASFWISMILLSLLVLAISAYARSKLAARALIFAIYFVLPAFGGFLNLTLGTRLGRMLNIPDMTQVIWAALFGTEPLSPFPLGWATLSLAGFIGISLWMLSRKVRAYEIVRS